MTDKQDLIREIHEYVTIHGGENTATHLLVQAASAIQTQAAELEAVGAGGVQALSAAPSLDERAPEAWTNLLAYVLQDDMHNRLTPRVVDIAYTAFNLAKQPNTEDGGSSDWFTDTKPTVDKLIAKLRKDLIEHLSASPTPPAEQQAQQAAPKAAQSDYEVRGKLAASLKCWHRLTGEEAAELVSMYQGRVAPQQEAPKAVPGDSAASLVVPDDCPHILWFDDQDLKPVVFAGNGAKRAALEAYRQASMQWNAHLFVRIAVNSRDCLYPCAAPQQEAPKAAPGEPNAFPMTGDEEESDLGQWQPGTAKPNMDGTYLREFDEGEATSEFHQGVWLRDGFFPSDLQDVRWRGRAAPQQEALKAAPVVPRLTRQDDALCGYLADCDDNAITPDVAGAFAWAWAHASVAAPQQEAQEPAFWMNEKGHTWSHSDWKQFPKHRAKYPIPLYPHFPAPQPAPAELERLRERIGRMGLDVDRAMRGHVNEQSPLGTQRLAAIAALAKPAPAPLSEREAFERDWEKRHAPVPINGRTHDDGRYGDSSIQDAWESWQARAALAAQGGQ